jgi:UDP-N-acetylglucosamine--N-acetylmuramyl-(pentapeptide) pyrophosphoryl-undecaprenol N-acetylglucosamine transferase
LANRVFSRFARVVALSFAAAEREFPRRARTVVTGNPIRREIAAVTEERDALAKEAVRELGLDEDRRTIVVFGGSQGALHIDRATVAACRLLCDRADLQLLLLTGRAHFDAVSRTLPERDGLLVRALPYLERMELAYAAAHLVVCRAGATTVAEITACGLPSILIPYPYATARHQEANARAVQRAGGASILLDDELTPESLAERIENLVGHDERLTAMAERAASFGRPDAAGRVAELVMEHAG